jgi:Flp pilus assembly protein TadG
MNAQREIRARWPRFLPRDERGQGLAELVITLPFLLLLALGLIEVSRAIEHSHTMSGLTREGANIASRGTALNDALTITRANQSASGLGTGGGAIASRIEVVAGVPRVVAQVASTVYAVLSRVGRQDSTATPYVTAGLLTGGRYFVVELFVPYQPITGFDRLLPGMIPGTLYDRSLF